ncbi:hypothetical protein C2G38_2186593 [Gigaspora rosea]|uniref:CCHC-type domain-containing protein n=1 Tax=Gigaspora rosea TaxID=44941 RepID=A0A397V6P4_9GLOM|nr:hypothetical protein C2G38_2186593 [Gigaspora rosea]
MYKDTSERTWIFKPIKSNVRHAAENYVDENNVNNSNITKHKGRPPNRLKSSVELSNQVLRDSTRHNIKNDGLACNSTKNSVRAISDIKGRKCGKYRQFGHYAKTCPNK